MIKELTKAHTFECKILLGQGNQFSRYLLTYTSTFDISINCIKNKMRIFSALIFCVNSSQLNSFIIGQMNQGVNFSTLCIEQSAQSTIMKYTPKDEFHVH